MKNKNNEKKNNNRKKSTRPIVLLAVCSISFLLMVSFGSYIFFRMRVGTASSVLGRSVANEYSKYCVLICDDTPFWEQVHDYAINSASEENILIDMISKRLNKDYSKADLLKIAIEAKVDGILLEGEDTDEMRELIAEADSRGICVVTIETDCTDSKRKSFVQAGSYNLGKIYGEQIISNLNRSNNDIVVVMDGSDKASSQNIIYSGIQDTINSRILGRSISFTPLLVDARDSFATEEDIRKIFIENDSLPDAFVCLNEQSTSIVYQALVDYNQVGNTRLIGFYNSDSILNGIKQGVIEATVSVDTKELGEYAIEALSEYLESGHVSEYYSVDSELITSENIGEYFDDEKAGE